MRRLTETSFAVRAYFPRRLLPGEALGECNLLYYFVPASDLPRPCGALQRMLVGCNTIDYIAATVALGSQRMASGGRSGQCNTIDYIRGEYAMAGERGRA